MMPTAATYTTGHSLPAACTWRWTDATLGCASAIAGVRPARRRVLLAPDRLGPGHRTCGPPGGLGRRVFGSRIRQLDSDATLLDVFGLGALTHLILTCTPPAASGKELASRLGTERALAPSAVSDEISPAMDDLVRRDSRSAGGPDRVGP